MKMKKKWTALLLALVMILSLAACGGNNGGKQNTSEPPKTDTPSPPDNSENPDTEGPKETVTLQMWGGVQGEYGYDALVEAFNSEFADKGIQVEYTRYVNNDDGNLQLDTYLSAGSDIDIFMCYGGTTKYYNRVDAGLCLDLTDELASRGFDPAKELGATNVAPYAIDGRFYAMPTKTDNKAWMMVNADMFKEAGIDLPLEGWTYAEFMDACQKLTKGEGLDKTSAVRFCFADTKDYLRAGMGSPLGINSIYKDGAKETNFDSEVWQNGIQMLCDAVEAGYAYGWDDEVADDVSFANSFLEGKCAMSLGVANIRVARDLETYPHDFQTALVPFPVPDESYMDRADHGIMSDAGDLIVVNSKTKYPQECIDFIVWYIQGGMAPLASGGRIPLWSGFDKSSIVDAVNEGTTDAIPGGAFNEDSLKAYLSIGVGFDEAVLVTEKDAEVETIFDEELQAIMYGQKSVEQGLADMKSRSDALLK